METKGAMRRIGSMRRMRRGLGDLVGRWSRRSGRIPVDVERREGGFVVRAALPGYDRRDLAVTAYRDGVRIVADGERGRETGGGSRRERPRLEHTVDLPAEIDESSAVAEYHAGTLTIEAAERRAAGQRSIPGRIGSREGDRIDAGTEGRGGVARRRGVDADGREADVEGRGAVAEGRGVERRPMGPTDEEIREYEARADAEFDRQRDFQRDKSGRQYRRK